MRNLILPFFLLAAGCAFPQFITRKTVEDSLPADGLRELHCTSHNGDITIEGKPGASEIRVRVEMSVRGHTQAEADANIEGLDLSREMNAGRLTLAGTYDRSLSNMSPSFTFVVEGPPALVMQLVSHNGDIRARGANGSLACETHNGSIEATTRANDVKFVTHNGSVVVDLDGSGTLNGTVTSHNGNVVVGIGVDADTSIEASTHNGRITLDREASDASISPRSLECQLGQGGGSLEIETHNGNVVIR